MRLRSTIFPLALLLIVWQSPQDLIRRHYETAEAERAAGNLTTAEAEYTAILAEGYARLGEISLGLEEPEHAVTALESAVEYQPNSTPLLISLAIAYFDFERYDMAIDVAHRALVLEPQNSGAHQMLGKSYFMLGDMGKAIDELEAAARLSPNDIDIAYTLGIAYLRNRQPTEAKKLYESMLQQFGDRPQLHVVIGRAYRQSGLLGEAAAEFRKAIALDARFPRAHYYLGITYLLDEGQSKISDALQEFKIEAAQNPDEFLANYYLGVVYVFQRQWQSAIAALEKASAIAPNDPDPYFQLGQAYEELNEHERAVEVLKKSIALNPDLGHNKGQVTTAHHRLAQSLIKLGQIEAGRKELELASDLKAQAFKLEQQTPQGNAGVPASRLLSEDATTPEFNIRKRVNSEANKPDGPRVRELRANAIYYEKVVATAHNNIGFLRAEQRDFSGAAKQFARAMKWNSQQEGVAFNLGLAYYKSQYYDRVIPALEQELKVHPENHAAETLLGLSCFMLQLYPQASEILSRLVEANASDLNLRYALAASLIRQEQTISAQPFIEQLKTIPAAADYLHLLNAEMYRVQGDAKRAVSELNDAAITNSNTLMIHYYAGLLYLKLDKIDTAAREFARESMLNPDDIQAKYQLANILLSRKNSDRGIAMMTEIIQIRPEDSAARYALGKALLSRRDLQAAIENLELAARLKPENAEFHYQLGQAYLAAGREAEGKDQIAIANKLKGKTGNQQSN